MLYFSLPLILRAEGRKPASMKDNQSYYDDFAGWYENERHHGYHALLDQLQIEVAMPLCEGKDVLELGCGTGLILKEIAPKARSAKGIDISPGMLEQAKGRGLDVQVASATQLPFEDESFDAVYSFKVLAHVEDIEKAMSEVARVLRPGGRAALEFYNRRSLRYLINRLKRPHQVSQATTDDMVYTRYDTLADITGYLPDSLSVDETRGIRVFTPFAQVHLVPGVKHAFAHMERAARDNALTRGFGGFLVVILSKS